MSSDLRRRQAESLRNLGVPGTGAEDAEATNGDLDARGRAAEQRLKRQIREATRSRAESGGERRAAARRGR